MKRLVSVLFASAFLVTAGFTPARAETVQCTAIASLPAVISAQGVYCLTAHLSTAITTGAAITITTNNVVLDLNGFKIGGLGAGTGTEAVGIYAHQRQNITIKNGIVRGFATGIYLQDNSLSISQGHLIEDIRADQNTYIGIMVNGKGITVRNNMVVATGGSTAAGNGGVAYGIMVAGSGARVLNNDVAEVTGTAPIGWAYGISLANSSNSVVAGNRISTITAAEPVSFGIRLHGENILVSDNRISGALFGIYFDPSSTGKYMNNMTMGVATPYTNGTAAGGTNY